MSTNNSQTETEALTKPDEQNNTNSEPSTNLASDSNKPSTTESTKIIKTTVIKKVTKRNSIGPNKDESSNNAQANKNPTINTARTSRASSITSTSASAKSPSSGNKNNNNNTSTSGNGSVPTGLARKSSLISPNKSLQPSGSTGNQTATSSTKVTRASSLAGGNNGVGVVSKSGSSTPSTSSQSNSFKKPARTNSQSVVDRLTQETTASRSKKSSVIANSNNQTTSNNSSNKRKSISKVTPQGGSSTSNQTSTMASATKPKVIKRIIKRIVKADGTVLSETISTEKPKSNNEESTTTESINNTSNTTASDNVQLDETNTESAEVCEVEVEEEQPNEAINKETNEIQQDSTETTVPDPQNQLEPQPLPITNGSEQSSLAKESNEIKPEESSQIVKLLLDEIFDKLSRIESTPLSEINNNSSGDVKEEKAKENEAALSSISPTLQASKPKPLKIEEEKKVDESKQEEAILVSVIRKQRRLADRVIELEAQKTRRIILENEQREKWAAAFAAEEEKRKILIEAEKAAEAKRKEEEEAKAAEEAKKLKIEQERIEALKNNEALLLSQKQKNEADKLQAEKDATKKDLKKLIEGISIFKVPRNKYSKIKPVTLKLCTVENFQQIADFGEVEEDDAEEFNELIKKSNWVLYWNSTSKSLVQACLILGPKSVRIEEGMTRGSFSSRKAAILKLPIKKPEENAIGIKSVTGDQRTFELLTENEKDKEALIKIIKLIVDDKLPPDIISS